MTRRVYLYFIVTTFLGAILGGAGVYYYLWHMGRLQHPFDKHVAEKHLKKELNLSDAQLQQVDRIFDESARKMAELQKQVEPQDRAIHMETRANIRKILDPDQAVKFDEFVRQVDERHKRHDAAVSPK
jgi:hypothetical protein